MKKHRFLCMIVTLILVVAAVAPVTALASPNYSFEFTYSDTGDHPEERWYEKGDSEQKWVVTLYNTDLSNMSYNNILALKMDRLYDNNVDRWHTFSNYVQRYGIPYSSSVESSDMMNLNKKRMINGTAETSLYVTGLYNP